VTRVGSPQGAIYNHLVKQRILVTGADRGVGLALVEAWAARGAEVYGGLLEERPWPAGLAEPVRLDVTDAGSVARAAAFVEGPLDIVINNAGILGDIEHELDEADFDGMARVYDVNTLGSLRVTGAFLTHLLAGPTKLVVNISSEAGSIGQCSRTSWHGYAMAKAALNMQSALVHNWLRPHGGRVLVLHPGHVRTFMRGTEDTTGVLSPDEAARRILVNIDRFGSVRGERPEFRGPDGELLPW
jgi:NAD(P)-dependent dehydrogenase (short-subunit alcohol dehydrogenase family)